MREWKKWRKIKPTLDGEECYVVVLLQDTTITQRPKKHKYRLSTYHRLLYLNIQLRRRWCNRLRCFFTCDLLLSHRGICENLHSLSTCSLNNTTPFRIDKWREIIQGNDYRLVSFCISHSKLYSKEQLCIYDFLMRKTKGNSLLLQGRNILVLFLCTYCLISKTPQFLANRRIRNSVEDVLTSCSSSTQFCQTNIVLEFITWRILILVTLSGDFCSSF